MNIQFNITYLIGETVKTVNNIQLKKGFNSIDWNGTDNDGHKLPAGIYFMKIIDESNENAGMLKLIKL